jgi:hypothetical protein
MVRNLGVETSPAQAISFSPGATGLGVILPHDTVAQLAAEVEVQTEAPGFAPSQVEELITRPVESSLSGAQGLDTMRSQSIPGLSESWTGVGQGRCLRPA